MKKLKYLLIKFLQRNNIVYWVGKYPSWADAITHTTSSYEDKAIIDKVREMHQKVLNGEVLFERDGMSFQEPQYNFPLISAFDYIFSRESKSLNFIDFGGGLGGLYFQNKTFLQNKISKWTVIEQHLFVKIGKENFQSDVIDYSYDFFEAKVSHKLFDGALFSGVLQCIENPYEVLLNCFRVVAPKYILVDRTAIVTDQESFICVQKVQEQIVESDYPVYFFNESELTDYFIQNGYKLIFDFPSYCDPTSYAINGSLATWKGFFFEKI